MNRGKTLKFIKSQIDLSKANYPIFEIYLSKSILKDLIVDRTMLIEGDITIDDIESFFNQDLFSCLRKTDFHSQKHIRQYNNQVELLNSDLIDKEKVSIDLIWRGRFYKWSDVISVKNKDEFISRILSSNWRLIVTKNENEYFVRHDISPSYYDPGYSIPGEKDFRHGVEKFVEYLKNIKDKSMLDENYDYVNVFAKDENGSDKKFRRCIPNFFKGKYSMVYREFEKAHIEDGIDVVASICKAIENSLN